MKEKIIRGMMLFVITALFASCTQPVEVIPGYEGTRLNPDHLSDVQFVRNLSNAMMAGDREGMEMHMHEDFFTTGPAIDDHTTRQEEIDSWLYFAEHFDDVKFSGNIYYSFICDEFEGRPELVGKWVLTWGNVSYRSKYSGKTAMHPYHFSIRIREGKVDYIASYYDRLSRNKQLSDVAQPETVEE